MKHSIQKAPFIVLSAFTALASYPAWGHAFGQRYDLPAPLWMYLWGAGAAVALSFVVMAFMLRRDTAARDGSEYNISASFVGRVVTSGAVVGALQLLSVAIFFLVLATGFFGVQSPIKNFAPPMVWIIWWIGMALISALIGDFWCVINPWRTLFLAGERLFGAPQQKAYPAGLAMWPAVILFAIFAWLELVSEVGESPRQLAYLIVIYSTITLWGMAVYGRENWLLHGEAFTVAFSLFARFAPTGAGKRERNKGAWVLRMPTLGLLTEKPVTPSLAAFALIILATVTYDGFLETPAWLSTLEWIAEDATLRPLLIALQDAGVNLHKLVKTTGLILFPAGFALAFCGVCFLMRWAGGIMPLRDVMGYFVLTLVPIAIAYHVAHYLSYFLLSGQLIIALVSDPFGFGWDLFNTADYKIDIGLVTAKFVWYLSVISIVLGHLIAVYLAHVMALRIFPSARAALMSQIPMMILMVGYTVLSLWILSQPVVETSGMPGS